MQDARGRHDIVALAIASAYVALAAGAAQAVNRIVTAPYLDEVFHIPQAQRYCAGQYNGYDPKLTTPPGLYALSVGGARIAYYVQKALPFTRHDPDDSSRLPPYACHSVPQLRYTCLLALLAMPWVFSVYVRAGRLQSDSASHQKGVETIQFKPTSPMAALVQAEADPVHSAQTARSTVALRRAEVLKRRRRGIWGVVGNTLDDARLTVDVHTIALLPPMWFFGFLYYTDVPSTMLVLSMLSAARHGRHTISATLGALSLSFRQTNVVWILFAIGETAIIQLSGMGLNGKPLARQDGIAMQLSSIAQLPAARAASTLVWLVLPYTPVFVLSAAFVVVNGAVVLGDRVHHQVSTHWVQPWYGVAFASAFAWPTLLSQLFAADDKGVRRANVQHLLQPLPLALAGTVAATSVYFGTVEHPFLLADNRHYAFYFWRRIINRAPWTPFLLVLPYALLARAWWVALSHKRSVFWLLGFVICQCAAVIPSPLIEPRYFLVPYLIARLELSPGTPPASAEDRGQSPQDTRQPIQRAGDSRDSRRVRPPAPAPAVEREQALRSRPLWPTLLELVWSLLINAASLYLFLYKPFRWPSEDGWQRFMW